MRFFRFSLFALALVIVSGSACTDEKLSSGTYRLSQVSFSEDECNIKENIAEGHEIELAVNDNAVMIYISKDLTPPNGTIIGKTFMAFASTENDLIPGTNCRDMWIKKITGTIIKKGVFTGVYEFNDRTIAGADCAEEENIGFHPPRCTSTMTFTATKN